MINLAGELNGVKSVAIAGHIRPDGDAVGACLGLYHYLKKNYPEIETTVYLEPIPAAFQMLAGVSQICHDFEQEKTYDVFFGLDCSDISGWAGRQDTVRGRQKQSA